LNQPETTNVVNAPTIMNSPWAMLITPIKPNTIDRPSASRIRMLVSESPSNVILIHLMTRWYRSAAAVEALIMACSSASDRLSGAVRARCKLAIARSEPISPRALAAARRVGASP
jgi:hypothetical protein